MNKRGFTLVELLMSIAMITLLIGISVPIYRTVQAHNNLDLGLQIATQTLRLAQLSALAGSEDASWGVDFDTGQAILFKGESFLTRDPEFDQVHELPQSLVWTGSTEIVFQKFTGLPTGTSELIVTSVDDRFRTLTVSGLGLIDYD
jgi:prepilin-type N-terminal cleavage/methylation domain-containing protein